MGLGQTQKRDINTPNTFFPPSDSESPNKKGDIEVVVVQIWFVVLLKSECLCSKA